MTSIIYLFDPLCGWCYGASPTIQRLRAEGVALEAVPTGLFSGQGARPMDASFASFAWENDKRIQRLTGQVFSETYRTEILGKRLSLFDSTAATLAVAAAGLDDPSRRFDALKAIQTARYVDGRDITRVEVLADVLNQAGLTAAAARLSGQDSAVAAEAEMLSARGRGLYERLNANGVPALAVGDAGRERLVSSNALFSSYDNLQAHLRAAWRAYTRTSS